MIKHFKAKAFLAFLVFYFVFSANVLNAFTSKDIISPCNGVWNNIQALVLNDLDDSELYYSFTGSDPLSSGFSYDGPILIDAVGDISLNIAAVSKDGKRSDFKVSYTVVPFSTLQNQDDAFFISSLQQNPIISVSPDSPFSIPSDFSFCMSNDADAFYSGQKISVDAANVLERYVPCIIKGNGFDFHMVLHILSSVSSNKVNNSFSAKLPFNIENWNNFRFTEKKYIFKIDDSLWSGDTDVVFLDRSTSHTVYWQDVAFELGNPVESYVIPSIPAIVPEKKDNGSVLFSFAESDSGYSMQISNNGLVEGSSNAGNASTVLVDTVFGDEILTDISFDVFYNGKLQGKINSRLEIDKRPPAPPKIVSSSSKNNSREKVSVTLESEPGATIYYAVSEGVNSSAYKSAKEMEEAVSFGEYKTYSGEKIEFGSINGDATYYSFKSYAVDSNGNISQLSNYSVVIDEYNVYLDTSLASLSDSEGDGSSLNPFKTFAAAIKYVNNKKNSNLYLLSPVTLDNQNVKITSDCKIIGKDTSILLKGKSVINIEKANVFIKDCFITRNDSETSSSQVSKIFSIKNSNVTFDNCEILGIFKGDASIADVKSSVIKISNSGFTLQASSYGSLFNMEKADVDVVESRFTASGNTSVCFSIHGGTFCMFKSSCNSLGKIGRCIELTSVQNVRVKSSSLSSLNSVSSTSSGLFWADKNTSVLEYEDNDENAL